MKTMMQRVKCLFGRHLPSRRRARETPDGRVSVCKGCGRPMMRAAAGWIAT
jgi:hypothetical protein